MPSLTIPWTLELWGKHIAQAAEQKSAFIAEFDCELSIDWEPDYYGDGYTYRIDAVTVEWGKNRHIITPKSDPDMWVILKRGIDNVAEKLRARILEGISESLSDQIYAASNDRAFMEYR
jgi:hypothetical protein